MGIFFKKVSVRPTENIYLFKKNKLVEKLPPGLYKKFRLFQYLNTICLPTNRRILNITNQEVLTKDNIALRFSYIIEYKIFDGEKLLSQFNLFDKKSFPLQEVEVYLHNLSQVCNREEIAKIDSDELNENRDRILNITPKTSKEKLDEIGIEILKETLKDISFPKMIQELFAKKLEAKIRSKADLENARTAVATARTLKNAAELIKKDDNIKYLQYLEMINKIAAKGRHTFMIGDLNTFKPLSK